MSILKKLFFNSEPKGLTLPEYKTLSNHDGEIKTLPIYNKYAVSLLQRDGEVAIPCVKIGDKVHAGQVIAKPTSHMALYRHSPTSGEVTGIIEIRETHASQMLTHAIEITADGLDSQAQDMPPMTDYLSQPSDKLLTRIFEAGIAGMGGAGFPTEKKLNLDNPVETLIINGAECEPYITCDDILMRHHAQEILQGALIFAHILQSKQILVGIEDNKPEAIAQMQAAAEALAKKHPNQTKIEIHTLPTKYPMGSRHQIAHFLLGKKPDIHKRSYQSGFICHNVATAKATYDAVILGKPLIERLVTFSGDAVGKAGVYRVKCGSYLSDISNSIHLSPNHHEVIFGGTMMGFAVDTENPYPIVIKRETTSVLAFKNRPAHEVKQASTEKNCIRCGHCADVCPMDLLPQQLQFYGKSGEHEKAQDNRLFDCIECGLCTYVCPSDIPLVQVFQHSKGEIINERKKKQQSEIARIRFETRTQRIEQEKAARAKKAELRRKKLKKPAAPASPIDNAKGSKSAGNKADLIAAALARTQAKKAQQNTETTVASDNKSDNKQDLIAAALARTKAKKAQLSSETSADADSKQDLIAAALARTKAKKAQLNSETSADADSKQDLIAAALARTKAKKAQLNNETSDDADSKQDLIAAALARTKAKKAQQLKQTTEKTD